MSRNRPVRIHLYFFTYGGIDEKVHTSVLQELLAGAQRDDVTFAYSGIQDDALISRSRSRAASKFLAGPADVLFMLDHDVAFQPGNLIETALRAHKQQAVVGGFYSNRAYRQGHASRFFAKKTVAVPGEDRLLEAEYVATGFLAVPRAVVDNVHTRLLNHPDPDLCVRECAETLQGGVFRDSFRCISIPSELVPGKYEYLSEDWAFCYRARKVGAQCFLWTKPILTHFGRHGFTVEDGIR